MVRTCFPISSILMNYSLLVRAKKGGVLLSRPSSLLDLRTPWEVTRGVLYLLNGETERVAELFNAAKVRFDHYGVKSDERVLILADSGTYEPMLDAVYTAAVATGADVTLLKMKARDQPWNWEMPPLLEHAIYNADFTFTLLSGRWFYNVSSERVRGHMRTTGKRMGSWGAQKQPWATSWHCCLGIRNSLSAVNAWPNCCTKSG